MRRLCSFFLAPCLLAAMIVPALAAVADTTPVYTWVDGNGVRHYSDHPAQPDAKLLAPAVPVSASAPAAVARAAAPSSAPPPRNAAKAAESPAARAARCAKLRDEVERLQSARRVRVNENGKSRYLAGDDLVKFKAGMAHKMHAACSAPASG